MRKIFVNEYSPSNPKIDLYVNGHYQYSTNFFSRCKDAKDYFTKDLLSLFDKDGAVITAKKGK